MSSVRERTIGNRSVRGEKPRALSKRGRQVWNRAAFLFPAVVLLLLFRFWPTLEAVNLSLTSWNGLRDPVFVGWGNYRRIVTDPAFLTALRNNLVILGVSPIGVVVPLAISLILRTRVLFWNWFRAAYFLPAVLSPVIVGTYYSIVLRPDGAVNAFLARIGLERVTRPWLAEVSTALPTYIAVMIWSVFGIGVLVFLAALGNVDPDVEDSARVEGASWIQVQRYVTLPAIRHTIQFWFAVFTIFVFTAQFPLVYTLTRGGPGHSSNVLEFLVYQRGFGTGSLGYAAAVGVVLFLIVAIVLTVASAVFRRLGWVGE